MPAMEPFYPDIDRYDWRRAAHLFQLLWPDEQVARAVAIQLAASIRFAHAVSEASWGVTMWSNGLRLNVGQVETWTCWEDTTRFLFEAPLVIENDLRFEIDLSDEPVYASVPVPSGVCRVATVDLVDIPHLARTAHERYIQQAATLKPRTPHRASHSPAVLEYIESLLSIRLPRPSYTVAHSLNQYVVPLADELDVAEPLVEGAQYQITVNAYERSAQGRQECIEHYGCNCVICGFSFGATYGSVAEGFIHVHHLRPLSEVGAEYVLHPIDDLRPVCPNCHAVLHRRTPPYSIEEVSEFLKQQQKE